jgi:molybdopterin converting factor small subunit
MRVRVRLYATYSRYAPAVAREGEPEKAAVDLPEGTTVRDALARLGLPADAPKLVFVNRRRADDLARTLADGDELAVFPPIGGG